MRLGWSRPREVTPKASQIFQLTLKWPSCNCQNVTYKPILSLIFWHSYPSCTEDHSYLCSIPLVTRWVSRSWCQAPLFSSGSLVSCGRDSWATGGDKWWSAWCGVLPWAFEDTWTCQYVKDNDVDIVYIDCAVIGVCTARELRIKRNLKRQLHSTFFVLLFKGTKRVRFRTSKYLFVLLCKSWKWYGFRTLVSYLFRTIM